MESAPQYPAGVPLGCPAKSRAHSPVGLPAEMWTSRIAFVCSVGSVGTSLEEGLRTVVFLLSLLPVMGPASSTKVGIRCCGKEPYH